MGVNKTRQGSFSTYPNLNSEVLVVSIDRKGGGDGGERNHRRHRYQIHRVGPRTVGTVSSVTRRGFGIFHDPVVNRT